MEWWLLIFFLGAILSLFIPIVPEFSLLFLIFSFSLLLLLHKKTRLVAVVFLGACWILMAGNQYQGTLAENNIFLEELQKKTLIVRGTVANIVNQQPDSKRFNFMISHWQGQKLKAPFLVRLSWKTLSNKLLQGQQWQLAMKLKPAHGMANVGGFNYQTWLAHQQIVATGYVKADTVRSIKKNGQENNQLITKNVAWRQQLYEKITSLLAEKPLGALLLALGFGERGQLSDEQWQVLSATATVHLIAISGLHIGIVAFFSFILARSALKILPLTMLLSNRKYVKLMRFNVKYLPILISCFVAWYYAYLAGYAIPTLRALVMLQLFWLLKASAVNVSLMRWLLLTIFVILLLWPLSLLSASFWLSISALSIIFATSSRFLNRIDLPSKPNDDKPSVDITDKPEVISTSLRWLKIKHRFYHWCKTLIIIQFALTACMLPIAASLNYQLPLLAFFANIIAVPFMSMTTIPLTLFAVITVSFNETVSQLFLNLAHFSLTLIWRWLSYVAEIEWAQLSVSNTQLEHLYLIIIALFLMLYFRFSKRNSILVAVFVTMIISTEVIMADNNEKWRLSVFDVGHGLAVVIEKNQRVFIYDTGARYPSGFNMAAAAILPYLKYQGYQVIDGVIISHNDNDHAGGLRHLRTQIPIKQIIANDMILKPNNHCLFGQKFIWQGLSFEVLSPVQIDGNKNDSSCVVIINDGFHQVLLPGDISSKQEKRLLKNQDVSDKLASDILIAPHHGSKSSSSRGFLAAVSPNYAVFSTGYLNRWKMPSEKITKRYQKQNITTFNTAELGMVTFTFTSSSIEPSSFRQSIKPYWFAN